MSKITIVLLVILAVLLIALVVLYFLGNKAQKKQAARKALLEIDNCGKKGLAYCIWLEKKDSNTTCLLTVMC